MPSQFGKTRYVEPDWQDALAASEAGDTVNWISFKGADPISDVPGDTSKVYRVKTARGNLVFKRFVPRSPWRYLLRRSRTSNEWAGLKAFRDAGFNTPELVAWGGGWPELSYIKTFRWCCSRSQPVASAGQFKAILANRSLLSPMGGAARAFVHAEFTWPQKARQIARVYDWVLGRKPKPEKLVRVSRN